MEEEFAKLLNQVEDMGAFTEFFISALEQICTNGTTQESSLDFREIAC